jgi:hypothetical protein
MEAFGLLMHGFAVLLTWKTLVLMMIGLVLGIFVGVLPGLGGPNFNANDEIIGARKVISSTATSEPMNDEVKAAVSASAALPCCAIG